HQPLAFDPVVAPASRHTLRLLGSPVRPGHDDTLDPIAAADAEGDRQFRLREIARAAPDHSGLGDPIVGDANGAADGVAIRGRADEPETQTAVAAGLVISQ